ncbi:chemotaxis protein CheW [Rickettsiales bacterium]|nr:chemotaxis protein CheW [Rickettsiales bacterium]
MTTQEASDINYDIESKNAHRYVSMRIDSQLFGMKVEKIEDILMPQEITPIPLSGEEIIGSLNLRGRIVTAIDLRVVLGIPKLEERKDYRSIVIICNNELYSLVVDSVSEVFNIPSSAISKNPENLSDKWKEICNGVYSVKDELMIILDPTKLLKVESDE